MKMKCNCKTANIICSCVGKIKFLYVRLVYFLVDIWNSKGYPHIMLKGSC